MSAIDNTPTNLNLQGPQHFKFIMNRAPMTEFFLQKCNIPDITMPSSKQPTFFNSIPHPGNELNYGPLNISFLLDENWNNFLEIHNWLRGIAGPENDQEYKKLGDEALGFGVKSDIQILVLSSKKNPTIKFTYVDAFPTSLRGFMFDTTRTDAPQVGIQATFLYTLYNVDISDV